jgi:prevent-host-death family protein
MPALGSYFCCVQAISLKMLRKKLSAYVRAAARGETILVTDRGRVVAELVPPRDARPPRLADVQLAEAPRRGWIAGPLLVTEEPPPRLPVARWSDLQADLEYHRANR